MTTLFGGYQIPDYYMTCCALQWRYRYQFATKIHHNPRRLLNLLVKIIRDHYVKTHFITTKIIDLNGGIFLLCIYVYASILIKLTVRRNSN